MSLGTLVQSIQQNVLRIGGPILITIGSISSILNLMVFTKGALRRNPCTICFVVVNTINFAYFYLGLLLTTLAVGYNIDPSASNLSFCRFRYYIALVFACSISSCLILASIDRTLITSPNAVTRKRSTRRLIITSMIIIGLFWVICNVHILVFMDILQYGSNYFVCYYQTGAYTTFMSYYSLLINGILPPLLLSIFGIWTMRNISEVRTIRRQQSNSKHTVATVVGRSYTIQSKDRQLIRMLLVDIMSYLICKCPAVFCMLYLQITQYVEKSEDRELIEEAILQLTYFWYFIDNSISCYTNTLVSKTFRNELKNIFLNIYPF
jgi:hypothetical protein